jgi:hypothetical protein
MNPIEQVAQLAKDADAQISITLESPDVLPFASSAISIIEANPELQQLFENEFLAMPRYAPSEFVEVCIHALMWPSLKHEFEKQHRAAIERSDWRAEPVYRHYLEAFDPAWDGAKDYYAAYFNERKYN